MSASDGENGGKTLEEQVETLKAKLQDFEHDLEATKMHCGAWKAKALLCEQQRFAEERRRIKAEETLKHAASEQESVGSLKQELSTTKQAFEEVVQLAEDQMRELADLEEALQTQVAGATEETRRAKREAALAEQMSMQIHSTSDQQQVQLIQSARQLSLDAKSARVELDRFSSNNNYGGRGRDRQRIEIAKAHYQQLSQQAATLAQTQMVERSKRQPACSQEVVPATPPSATAELASKTNANEGQQSYQKHFASPHQASPGQLQAHR
jgi:hypothetical protein